ncbi:hypothetical protein V2T44_24035 [Serratia ficaria]|jgi:hypothetical protein|uniref:hypothetical protein n=1 Tax=Serratia TaxID=613 RepID=UPI001013C703|nr:MULTISPECIES: hypothetical protein [Serratia]MEE4486004.1 hypothetical protein [Serratia ficaria]CAI2536188.1 Uncharacterised protein [Serratia ficaria]
MNETRALFLKGLNCLLDDNYSSSKVAGYAYRFYLDYDIPDEELSYVVDYLKGIDAGPEFEMSKDEVISFIKLNLK